MKVVILAAGLGSGMKSLSNLTPKSLIPIANRPIIEHLILNFQKANVSEIIILVGHLKVQIIEFLKRINLPSMDIKIVQAKNYEKGPIYTFYSAKNQDIKEDFILCPSDLFVSPKIISSLKQYHKKGSISIAIDSSKRHKHGTKVFTYTQSRLNSQNKFVKYGKVSGFNNRVLNKSDAFGVAIPLTICSPDIFDYVENAIAQNAENVTSALNIYIKNLKPLNYFDFPNDYWFDMDNLNDLLVVNQFALKNNITPINHISPLREGKIKDMKLPGINLFHPTTEIIPPIIIGKNCYSKINSKIGPYVSIYDNCGLEANSEIKNSIVFGNSQVLEDSKIRNTIIYKNNIIDVNLS